MNDVDVVEELKKKLVNSEKKEKRGTIKKGREWGKHIEKRMINRV